MNFLWNVVEWTIVGVLVLVCLSSSVLFCVISYAKATWEYEAGLPAHAFAQGSFAIIFMILMLCLAWRVIQIARGRT